MRRTDQRRAAIFICYQRDVTGARSKTWSTAVPMPSSEGEPDERPGAPARPYTRELVEGVDAAARGARRADRARTRSAGHVDRIAPLERAILRVALFEILHRPDVPDEVAIDEAVETRQALLRRRGPGFRQRHARRSAATGSTSGWTRRTAAAERDLASASRRPRAPAARRRPRPRARPARLAGECAELASRGGRGARPAGALRPAGPASPVRRSCCERRLAGAPAAPASRRAAIPTICARSSRTTSPSFASRRSRRPAGLDEAMRYSLLAGGKRIRPVLALATARALGARPERRAADRRGDRADPHLLADPRRPARDGRRRPAPRPADLPHRVRRERRDPGRRRAVRRGLPPRAASASRAMPKRVLAALRELSQRDQRRRHGRRPVHRRRRRGDLGADGLRHLHELKTGG